MTFSEFAKYLEKLEKITSRLEITAVLAELFKKVAATEIDKVCFLSLGRLGPFYEGVELNLAEKMVMRALNRAFAVSVVEVEKSYKRWGDLGEVARQLSIKYKVKSKKSEVEDVFNKLLEIANSSGAGSQDKKLTLLASLLRESEALAAKYLVRITLKKLRLGFSDKTLIEALSWMETGGKGLKNEIERAYFVYPNIGEIARRFKERGLRGLKSLRPEVGVPIMPQLCQRVPTAAEVLEKMAAVTAEPKYDGTRVQLHLDRSQKSKVKSQNLEMPLGDFKQSEYLIRTFTRNLEENTEMFPDLLAAADKQLAAQSAILDGEAVGFDPATGRALPFQETVQRKRKHGIAEKMTEVPLRLYLFDLLYLDGESLLGRPLAERRRLLGKILEGATLERLHLKERLAITPVTPIASAAALEKELQRVHAAGLEGLVLKDPAAAYEAGSRGFAWVKFKREEGAGEESSRLSDTIDAVVLGYYKGTGRRTAFGIGAFLVGVYDKKNDGFLTIAKIGTGLTDKQWREMRERCETLKVKAPPKNVTVNKLLVPDVWVQPSMVVVIRADEITRSPVHSANYALRFPRLMSWREDKAATDATSLEEFLQLYRQQRK